MSQVKPGQLTRGSTTEYGWGREVPQDLSMLDFSTIVAVSLFLLLYITLG